MTLAFGSAKVVAASPTTSAAFIDVPGAAVTLTTGASHIKVTAAGGNITAAAAGKYLTLGLNIDGVDVEGGADLDDFMATGAGIPVIPMALTYISAALTAGAHTIKLRMRSADGVTSVSVNASAGNPLFLYVEELPF